MNKLTSGYSRVNAMEYRFYDEDKALAAAEHDVLTLNQLLSLLVMSLLAWMGRR